MCGELPMGRFCAPVVVDDPIGGLVGMATGGPAEELSEHDGVSVSKQAFGTIGGMVVGPSSDNRVEGFDEDGLRTRTVVTDNSFGFEEVATKGFSAGFDDGFVTEKK